jgi:hypothetical protein
MPASFTPLIILVPCNVSHLFLARNQTITFKLGRGMGLACRSVQMSYSYTDFELKAQRLEDLEAPWHLLVV